MSILADQALELLLFNLHQDTFNYTETIGKRTITKTATWKFSTPCSSVSSVQDSTSTLLAARALAKAGNVTLAWNSIRALFSGQRADGFLPNYRYYDTDQLHVPEFAENDAQEYYINNTTIPGPRFGSQLASLPFHASVVLDVFAWSEQSEDDVQRLVDLYTSIYRYHHYMVEQRPHLWHPWESLRDVHSWIQPLSSIRNHMKAAQWKIPFEVPPQVLHSYDYHPDVYGPCVYLLECYANSTRKNETSSPPGTSSCPPRPQVWSVEHAAIWIQAHRDLLEMRRVLRDRHADWLLVSMDPVLPTQWLTSAQEQLERLWSHEHGSFLPKQDNQSVVVADATNFVALWTRSNDTSRAYEFASNLLLRDSSEFSFDCGIHAVWSRGGCEEPSFISPLLNYFISTGLERNDLHGISYVISNATTNKLFPISKDMNVDFPLVVHAETGLPFAHPDDVCSLRSTTTAAAVYNLATPTPARTYHPDPPIRSSGIIVLIIVELIVALAIGASCLFLNLKMLRESSRLVREEEEREDGFFSTTGSLGEHRYEAVVNDGSDD